MGIIQPTLVTSRLILEPFKSSDASDIFAYANDPEMAAMTTWEAHRKIEDSVEFLKWNKGYMSEAAVEVLRWAFSENPGLLRFQSYCDANNIGSRRVMEKAGLEFECI